MIAALFLLLVLLIFIGLPIAFSIGVTSLVIMNFIGLDMPFAITQTFSGVDSFTLMAIPFFILAGNIMGEAGIVDQIIDFANAMVGSIRGGLGHVNIIASMVFSGVSGSGVADSSAIGSILIPSMIKQGYDKDFSVAVTCTSSTIGPIIPPSIPMVLYGILTGLSIGKLFLGGIIPGILIGFGLMGMNHFMCWRRGYEFRQEKTSIKRIVVTFFKSFGALIMPLQLKQKKLDW